MSTRPPDDALVREAREWAARYRSFLGMKNAPTAALLDRLATELMASHEREKALEAVAKEMAKVVVRPGIGRPHVLHCQCCGGEANFARGGDSEVRLVHFSVCPVARLTALTRPEAPDGN